MRKITKVLVNASLVVGAIVISLAAALGLDHWLNLGVKRGLGSLFETNLQRPEPIMYVYDNRSGWRLNPLTQYRRARDGPFLGLAGLERFDAKLRVNSEGFIDREHFLKTPYYRIAFAGNSWLEAVQQEYEFRFAPLTEDFVFARSDHKRVVEIMNFGVSNLGPAQSYGVIKSFALKYQPDEIWLFVAGRDLFPTTPVETPPPFGPTFEYVDKTESELKDIHFGYVDPPAYAAWKRERAIGKYLLPAGFAQAMPHFYSEERNVVFDRGWRDMKLAVALIAKTLRSNGVRMRLVYLPHPVEVDPAAWTDYRRRTAKLLGRELAMDPARGEPRFAALAQELGVEFISLLPLCKQKGSREMIADHFTRAGHFWVAEYLARIIIDTAPAKANVDAVVAR